MNTIEEAKQFLRDHFDEGVECPVCKQRVKLYHRQITSSMAYGLIIIHRYFLANPEDEYVHTPSLAQNQNIPMAIFGGDFSKLRFWGLIEPMPGDREDGSWRNGWWGITDKGIKFVKHEILVPSSLAIYNQKPLGLEGEYVSIKDTLGKRFNFDELMSGLPFNQETPSQSYDATEQVSLF